MNTQTHPAFQVCKWHPDRGYIWLGTSDKRQMAMLQRHRLGLKLVYQPPFGGGYARYTRHHIIPGNYSAAEVAQFVIWALGPAFTEEGYARYFRKFCATLTGSDIWKSRGFVEWPDAPANIFAAIPLRLFIEAKRPQSRTCKTWWRAFLGRLFRHLPDEACALYDTRIGNRLIGAPGEPVRARDMEPRAVLNALLQRRLLPQRPQDIAGWSTLRPFHLLDASYLYGNSADVLLNTPRWRKFVGKFGSHKREHLRTMLREKSTAVTLAHFRGIRPSPEFVRLYCERAHYLRGSIPLRSVGLGSFVAFRRASAVALALNSLSNARHSFAGMVSYRCPTDELAPGWAWMHPSDADIPYSVLYHQFGRGTHPIWHREYGIILILRFNDECGVWMPHKAYDLRRDCWTTLDLPQLNPRERLMLMGTVARIKTASPEPIPNVRARAYDALLQSDIYQRTCRLFEVRGAPF